MKNFYRLAQGVDVVPLVMALKQHNELWNENQLRTEFEESPHREASDIWLRFNVVSEDKTKVVDDCECVDYPPFNVLYQAKPIIFDLMRRVEGKRLGRVIITKLAPGDKTYPHADGGAPAEYYERFHVMLQNQPGSIFRAGDETVFTQPGEVWWFDNQQEHEVINNSADDRITMIVDIRSK